jgi:hypothetical protein
MRGRLWPFSRGICGRFGLKKADDRRRCHSGPENANYLDNRGGQAGHLYAPCLATTMPVVEYDRKIVPLTNQ